MRKIIAVLLAIALVMSLAACSSNAAPEKEAPKKDASATTPAKDSTDSPAEPVTLEMWGMTDDQVRYEAIIAAYQELHPEVTINLTLQSSSEYDQAQTTALAGREPIDIIVSNGGQYLEGRASNGMAEPLNAYMEASGFDTSVYSDAFASTAINGQFYGLPYRDSVCILIYNKTYFDERNVPYPTADTTWDELLDIAEKVTWGEGADKVYGFFCAARNTDWNMMATINGTYSTSEDLTLLADSMNWKLDAIDRGVILDNAAYTAFGTGIRAMFASGKSSMYLGGDWTIAQLNGDYRNGVFDFEWDVAPLPMMPDGTGRMKTTGQYVYASVVSYSEHKQEAYDFLTFMCGPEGAAIGAQDGMMPAAKKGDSVKEAFHNYIADTGMPASVDLYFELETVQPPIVAGYAQMETLLKQEADMVFSRMETVDQAIENLKAGQAQYMN